MSKTRVPIERVLQCYAILKAVNVLPFDEIEWTHNGKPIAVSKETADDFRFTGLNNASFVQIFLDANGCEVNVVADAPIDAAKEGK